MAHGTPTEKTCLYPQHLFFLHDCAMYNILLNMRIMHTMQAQNTALYLRKGALHISRWQQRWGGVQAVADRGEICQPPTWPSPPVARSTRVNKQLCPVDMSTWMMSRLLREFLSRLNIQWKVRWLDPTDHHQRKWNFL